MVVGVAGLVLSACQPTSGPSPTTAPPRPTEPAKPAAASPASTAAAPAAAQTGPPLKLTVGNLAIPSLVAPLMAIVADQKLDAKNGLQVEFTPYPSVAAYYSALQTGEVESLAGGPHVLQRMRNEGVPIQALATYAPLSPLAVITPDASITSVADLKGKKLAADMGSSEFQVLATYARGKGIDLRRDASVVQAGPPQVQAMLRNREVDAGMTWEPGLTQTLRDDPAYKIIFEGDKGWREATGQDGYELVVLMREDAIKRDPAVVPRWISTLQDAATFAAERIDQADAIAVRDVKLQEGVFREAAAAGRLKYDIRPAWEPAQKQGITRMFQVAVETGLLDKLPDDGAFYTP